MSVIYQSPVASCQDDAIALLAASDLDRCLVWRDGAALSVGEFLADVQALAALLPPAKHAVNLCADRYRFLVAFCAVAVAGQTNLLPSSRAPQVINDVLREHAESYTLSDNELDQAPPRLFVMPRRLPRRTVREVPRLAAGQIVTIGFTSGSTGRPGTHAKTWGSLCASSAHNAALLCNQPSPVNLVATVPPQHMYGLETSVLLPLRSNTAVHAGQPFFPADIVNALQQIPAPRVLITTPVHLRALLRETAVLPAVDAIVSATAPLQRDTAVAAESRYRTRVIEVFGSTETCVIAHRRTAVHEGWQLYRDIQLHPQPDGTEVDAPHLDTPKRLSDIVELLPQNRFVLRGRNSDLLEVAGKRASLGELNRQVLAIAGVEDAVVFQLDAETSGVRRLAALVVAPDLSEAQILASLRLVIDPAFLPRPLRRVATLPRNGTGKLPREALLAALKA